MEGNKTLQDAFTMWENRMTKLYNQDIYQTSREIIFDYHINKKQQTLNHSLTIYDWKPDQSYHILQDRQDFFHIDLANKPTQWFVEKELMTITKMIGALNFWYDEEILVLSRKKNNDLKPSFFMTLSGFTKEQIYYFVIVLAHYPEQCMYRGKPDFLRKVSTQLERPQQKGHTSQWNGQGVHVSKRNR